MQKKVNLFRLTFRAPPGRQCPNEYQYVTKSGTYI